MTVATRWLVIVNLLLASAEASRPPNVGSEHEPKVYYFGLFTSTSIPIDEGGIEERYDLTSVVRKIVPDIVKMLSEEELPYVASGYQNVRLKIVSPKGGTILLDLNGNVSGLGKPHRLSVDTRKKLIKLIHSALPE